MEVEDCISGFPATRSFVGERGFRFQPLPHSDSVLINIHMSDQLVLEVKWYRGRNVPLPPCLCRGTLTTVICLGLPLPLSSTSSTQHWALPPPVLLSQISLLAPVMCFTDRLYNIPFTNTYIMLSDWYRTVNVFYRAGEVSWVCSSRYGIAQHCQYSSIK